MRLLELLASRANSSAPLVGQLTGAEVDEAAGRVAAELIARGLEVGDRVAILLPRSETAHVAVHGVLRAGMVSVPLDLGSPAARLQAMIADAGARVVLADRESSRAAALRRANPDLELIDPSAARGPAVPPTPVDDERLATILYTSGSTGQPKGVALSHGAVAAFVDWSAAKYLEPGDRVAGLSPLNFDLSTFELFATVQAGARTCPAPQGITAFPSSFVDYLRTAGITVVYAVPSVLTRLLQADLEGLEHLRLILYAGEVFPSAALTELTSRLPHARFHNLFGPTETNVIASYALPAGPWPGGPVPIGAPASGAVLRVTDVQGREAPPGQAGELWVAGPSLFAGYWGHETPPTVEIEADGARRQFYRTGDQAAWRDGQLFFLGRMDNQLKIHGFRIQPEEIENALSRHPAVRATLVDSVEASGGLSTIRARVELIPGQTIDAGRLRRHCAELLPGPMVPSLIEIVPELPRSTRGKLVRRT